MPLIDAYIKCDNIEGSYKGSTPAAKAGSVAKLEETHDGWSEIYEFSYSLTDAYPSIEIIKPVDNASNDLYLRFLKNHSRERQKGKADAHKFIKKMSLHVCRWVDTNEDGIVDEFQYFIDYTFLQCRVLSYDVGIDFEADDIPEEKIVISFREMQMEHYHPDDPSIFSWDFMKAQSKASRK